MELTEDDIEVIEEGDRGVYIFRQDCELQEIKDSILNNQKIVLELQGYQLITDRDKMQQILKNQENISPDKAVEYVLENHYDEVREAVFEQEAESQRE